MDTLNIEALNEMEPRERTAAVFERLVAIERDLAVLDHNAYAEQLDSKHGDSPTLAAQTTGILYAHIGSAHTAVSRLRIAIGVQCGMPEIPVPGGEEDREEQAA